MPNADKDVMLGNLVERFHEMGLSQLAAALNLWLCNSTEKQQISLTLVLFDWANNFTDPITELIKRNS